ncbi:LPS assembly lipoprotein LptE [uncultured Cohaesibacter sp.]|uniref:LPS assembly lipoprotein LptE n=1 Tax=uncultured Cohaesibacter sp. TaxID=1002546 RepID=UPI00292DAF28|nr:LPS assembly lipoprotein LptE [uncultured Cohaesibacter sp.]
MLLFSRFHLSKKIALAFCLGLGLTALSACQVRPLYSTNTTTGQTLSEALSTIEIEPAKNRVDQEIRNNLIFAFTGGGEAGIPAYKLLMKTRSSSTNLSIESGTGLAKSRRVSLTTTYRLVRLSNNTIVTKGSSFFTATYAKSTQLFTNDRAEIDAENRAAAQVANDIELRLSAFLASGI